MEPTPAPDLDADYVAQLMRAVDNVTLARCALVCVRFVTLGGEAH